MKSPLGVCQMQQPKVPSKYHTFQRLHSNGEKNPPKTTKTNNPKHEAYQKNTKSLVLNVLLNKQQIIGYNSSFDCGVTRCSVFSSTKLCFAFGRFLLSKDISFLWEPKCLLSSQLKHAERQAYFTDMNLQTVWPTCTSEV